MKDSELTISGYHIGEVAKRLANSQEGVFQGTCPECPYEGILLEGYLSHCGGCTSLLDTFDVIEQEIREAFPGKPVERTEISEKGDKNARAVLFKTPTKNLFVAQGEGGEYSLEIM